MQKRAEHSSLFYFLIVLAMCSWGASWITAKWAAAYPPEVTAFWRFVFTALSFVPILLWRRESFLLPRAAWRWTLLSGVSLALYNLCFLGGLKSGGGGYGGVMVPTLSPQVNFLLAWAFLGLFVRRLQLVGLALGLVGGMIQILGPHFAWGSFLRPENLYFLGAAFTYAVLTHGGALAQKSVSVFQYSFWLFVLSALLIFPVSLHSGPFEFARFGADFWINVAYLTLGAGTFGTTVYFEAARRVGASSASSFAFLVPVTALAMAWLFLGEVPAWTSVAGGALSIVAVSLIQRRPAAPAAPAAVASNSTPR